ncbi:MAG: amidohydrolase family protein [Planctomycetota bacterium]|jgi:predicted TIM-barrel fold metal-dependent hydrolase
MKVINVHAHLWDDQDVDERVAHYSCEGMVRICLIGREKARIAQEKYPDLVIGLGMVIPGEDSPEIIDTYRDWNLGGAKFISPSAPYDIDQYMPFYEKLQSHGMVATFHTGYVGGRRRDTSTLWMHPMTLDRIARRFPDLRIIGYHLGNPWYTEACSLALCYDNIHWGLSGGTVRATPLSYLKHIFSFRTLDQYGPGVLEHKIFDENVNHGLFARFCYATDNPAPVYMMDFMRDLMEALEVPDDIRELVWWRNAARIFGIEEEIAALPE